MFELNTQEFAAQYGLLVLFLPFAPSLAAAALALLIVRPDQRINMLGLAAAGICCCFGVMGALLPLLHSMLPQAWLYWESPFILLLPAVVTLLLALRLRGAAHAPRVASVARARRAGAVRHAAAT